MNNQNDDERIIIDLDDLDDGPQAASGRSEKIEISFTPEELHNERSTAPSYDRAVIGQTAHYQEPYINRTSNQELNRARSRSKTTTRNINHAASPNQSSRRVGSRGPTVNADGFYDYDKASLGPRFLAFTVDSIIASLPFIIGMAITMMVSYGGSIYGPSRGIMLYSITILLGSLWGIGYLFVRDGIGKGQSYGKKIFGLMTVRLEDNQPCTKANSILRNMIAIPLNLLDILYGAVHNKGQRLGDVQLKTQVIKLSDYHYEG